MMVYSVVQRSKRKTASKSGFGLQRSESMEIGTVRNQWTVSMARPNLVR